MRNVRGVVASFPFFGPPDAGPAERGTEEVGVNEVCLILHEQEVHAFVLSARPDVFFGMGTLVAGLEDQFATPVAN